MVGSDFTLRVFDCFRFLSVVDPALNATGRRVEVFLDRERLQIGCRFDDDFLQALVTSTVAVPMVSSAALVPMTKLKADSPVDNLLVELSLLVELQAVRKKKEDHHQRIVPLMMGTVTEKPGWPVSVSNLFEDPASPDASEPIVEQLPAVVVTEVVAIVREVLRRYNLKPSPALATRTVKATVLSPLLSSFPSPFLFPPHFQSLIYLPISDSYLCLSLSFIRSRRF